MSGNRGAQPGMEVRFGHFSVLCAQPDSKGVTVSRRLSYLLCQSCFRPALESGVLAPGTEKDHPFPDSLGSKFHYTVLEALFLMGCVAKTRFHSSLSQNLGKQIQTPFRMFSKFAECSLQISSQVETKG